MWSVNTFVPLFRLLEDTGKGVHVRRIFVIIYVVVVVIGTALCGRYSR